MSIDENKNLLSKKIDAIERLLGGAADRMSLDEIKDVLDLILKDHPMTFVEYGSHADLRLHRGRVYDRRSMTCEPYKSVNQIHARNGEDVGEYGRCHIPTLSVFYAAGNVSTMLAEIEGDTNNFVHSASFRIKNGKSINFLTVGVIDHIRRYGKSFLPEKMDKEIVDRYHRRRLDRSHDENLMEWIVDAFLAKAFSAPSSGGKIYKITSTIAGSVLIQHSIDFERVCGFIYPSVEHQGGMNFAIPGDQSRELLEPVECNLIRIQKWGFGIFTANKLLQSKSISLDGTISWEESDDVKNLPPELKAKCFHVKWQ